MLAMEPCAEASPSRLMPRTAYAQLVHRRAQPTARVWLEDALDSLEHGFDHPRFGIAFAAAGRLLGANPVALTATEAKEFQAKELLPPQAWGLDEIGRTALLLAALLRLPEAAHHDLVDDLFSRGDTREQQAVLKALPILPGPERF